MTVESELLVDNQLAFLNGTPMPDDRRTQQATLGCGTLILIAIIVLIFSRPGISDLENDVGKLRTDVGEMKRAIDTQTTEIRRLADKVAEGQRAK
jgi:hypothetical protein